MRRSCKHKPTKDTQRGAVVVLLAVTIPVIAAFAAIQPRIWAPA